MPLFYPPVEVPPIPPDLDLATVDEALGTPENGAETMSRNVLAVGVPTSGEAWLSFFTPLRTVTVNEITMGNSTPGAASVTTSKMGLYEVDENDNVTLVARTANDPTLFASTFTIYTRSFDTTGGFPAEYTLEAGKRYALGFIVVAGTMPAVFLGSFNLTALMGLEPILAGVAGSQTDLPLYLNTFTGDTPRYNRGNRKHWARFS
jgi:hypothetical protein